MTISVLQEKQISPGGAFASSLALAFTSSITAGSAIHAIFQYNGAVQTVNFSDNNGNTWPAGTLDNFNDPGNSSTCHQVLNNANAGATTITATITGSSTNFLCLWIKEIGGAATTGSPDGHNGVNSTSTTSQNISATNTSQPALISVLVSNDSTQEVPVLDASLTASSINPGWNYGGATSSTVAGHKRITSTGLQTLTNTQASADSLNAVMAIFLEAGGAAVPMGPKLAFINP